MKTTLNVSIDQDLLAEAQKVMDETGLSTSGAVSMLLRHLVLYRQLPAGLVHPMHDVPIAGGAGHELRAEVLLELMSMVAARLGQVEEEACDPAEKAKVAKVRQALQDKRFKFDSHDGAQVDALLREYSGLASTLAASQSCRGNG